MCARLLALRLFRKKKRRSKRTKKRIRSFGIYDYLIKRTTFHRCAQPTPFTCSFSILFIWFQSMGFQQKRIPLRLSELYWFEAHVLYQVVGKATPASVLFVSSLCYWERKRKYEESIVLGFFCLPSLIDSGTPRTTLRDDAKLRPSFGPFFNFTQLFEKKKSSLNWPGMVETSYNSIKEEKPQ
jgi:hypothetical protein